MREHAGIFDLSAFAIFDVQGAGALDALQDAVLAQMDVPVGRVVYTPVLSPGGGFKSDLTIMRLGDDHFRIVTGGAHGMADRKLFVDRIAGRRPGLVDVTTAWTTIGLWGPRARDILSRVTRDDVSHEGFPFGTCRRSRSARSSCSPRGSPTSATSAGSSTCRSSRARGSGTRSGRRGSRTGSPPAGSASTARPGRLEKGYRAYGAELETEYTSSRPACSGRR